MIDKTVLKLELEKRHRGKGPNYVVMTSDEAQEHYQNIYMLKVETIIRVSRFNLMGSAARETGSPCYKLCLIFYSKFKM